MIPFCGKVDGSPILNEKILANGKRCKYKDVLVGKLSISKADEEFNKESVVSERYLEKAQEL